MSCLAFRRDANHYQRLARANGINQATPMPAAARKLWCMASRMLKTRDCNGRLDRPAE
jgi:hypothetical protein